MLTDRSRMELFGVCPRARYWGYEHHGRGIARAGHALPLLNGVGYHKAFETILQGVPLEQALDAMRAEYVQAVRERGIYGVDDADFLIAEQTTLLEGLVRGWVQSRMAIFLDRYEIKAIEQEFPFTLGPGVTMMMRMDLVVRRKSDGMLCIPDFKGTSTGSSLWREGFRHNHQINAYVLALQETLGERVGGVVIEGLLKGQWAEDTALSSPFHGRRIQKSPFCYGFKHDGTGEVQAEYTARKGFVKIATWEHYRVPEWLEIMGAECVRDQFLTLEIPAPAQRELDDWREEMLGQELRAQEGALAIALDPAARRTLLSAYFPKTLTSCFRYGAPCAFEAACFDQTVGNDPVASGLYVARTPHHAQEMESLA